MNVPEAAASVLKPRACMWFKCYGFGAACPERDFPRSDCLYVFWCFVFVLVLGLLVFMIGV